MDKQELIEHYEKILDYGLLGVVEEKAYTEFVKKLEQLEEPQRVTIPQFVADWYEENKDDFEGNLFRCINTISSMYEDEELNDFENWVIEAHTKPFQTLVNMHQFGYTVEEKRYLVKMKGVTNQTRTLKRNIGIKTWYFGNPTNYEDVNAHHTRKELEQAGFGWVFDCPGIEIEEVE